MGRQRWDSIDRALLDAWADDLEHARAHGGESLAQFVAAGARVVRRYVRSTAMRPSMSSRMRA